MRERYHCGDKLPSLPDDRSCALPAGHAGPHGDDAGRWDAAESEERRELVYRAQLEAQDRAAHNARLEALGGRAPRGGLVGNRQQRRVGLRKVR